MPATISALEKLEELYQHVREAEERVAQAEQERARAGRALEAAKGPLRDYYEALGAGEREPDPALEKQLLAEIRKRDTVITTRPQPGGGVAIVDEAAEARVLGAKRVLAEREQAPPRFIVEHRDELVAELTDRSIAARDGLFAAIDEFGKGASAWQSARDAWGRMIPHWGISPSELPHIPVALEDRNLAPMAYGKQRDPARLLPMPSSQAPADLPPPRF